MSDPAEVIGGLGSYFDEQARRAEHAEQRLAEAERLIREFVEAQDDLQSERHAEAKERFVKSGVDIVGSDWWVAGKRRDAASAALKAFLEELKQ